ncbi:MAG: acetylxylan esterase [Planctomycetaceae bacterium]|nr:acetylxylan esterase [Planctomycetaceae bacterium]
MVVDSDRLTVFTRRVLLALLLLTSGGTNSRADERTTELSAALAVPVVAEQQALEDVRRFTASRIPDVPVVNTVAEWNEYAAATRAAALDRVVFRGKAAEWKQAWTKVERLELIEGGPGYQIQKLRLEVLPDLWVPALLYIPKDLAGKVPVFLNVNGHDREGKAADYKQARCIHMARQGVLALNLEWFGMGQLATPGFAHGRMNQLDLCGTSGLAPFYLAMSRAIDFLVSLENADPERIGVAGLSGGGWQTILISSLDTRVTLCNPVAGYSSFKTRIDNFSDLGDSEQTPVDLGITADYAHLTALLAPRAALLTYNDKDNCCFASGHALDPLTRTAGPVYRLFDQESRFRSHVNSDPGNHNFLLDNRTALYRMIRDQWFGGDDSRFATNELSVTAEIKSSDVLHVSLPVPNNDFQTLARSLQKSLPATAPRPGDAAGVNQWRAAQRKQLAEVVHPIADTATAEEVRSSTVGDFSVVHWKLQIGNDWTVPVVEVSKGNPEKSALIISDAGRQSAADHVARLADAGFRVFAFDPFYFGELSIRERAYLWALMISTVGERPIGVQAGQLTSVAQWIKERTQPTELRVVTIGPRTGVIGLVAAALNPDLLRLVDEHGTLESLKTLIDDNYSFEQAPELFCFGLLEHTDISHLRDLIRP